MKLITLGNALHTQTVYLLSIQSKPRLQHDLLLKLQGFLEITIIFSYNLDSMCQNGCWWDNSPYVREAHTGGVLYNDAVSSCDYMASMMTERVWSIGGIKLKGDNRSTRWKICPSDNFSAIHSTRSSLGVKLAWCRWLTVWDLAITIRLRVERFLTSNSDIHGTYRFLCTVGLFLQKYNTPWCHGAYTHKRYYYSNLLL